MAPDAQVQTAGKKLGNLKHWQNLGYNTEALWGQCQGSDLYAVSATLATLSIQCSCPSHKRPCKHGLGLLLIAASTPASIVESSVPEWVQERLTKAQEATQRKEARIASKVERVGKQPTAAQQKTARKRQSQISSGIETLNLWLEDLVRTGLGSLETQPATFWEKQAARMVDAQAPGIASRIRRLSVIPNASPDWPAKLLAQLGHIALLTHAYTRLDQLDPKLQEDVRLMVGLNLKEEDVIIRGEHVEDDWLVLGQITDETLRGIARRTWLLGKMTQRAALIDQFTPTNIAFSKMIPTGVCWHGELVFWPGVASQRSMILVQEDNSTFIKEALPGTAHIEDFCDNVANILACQPWRDRFLCILCNVTLIYESAGDNWYIRDEHGNGLPLRAGNYWEPLALSGGQALDFAGEWNGETLIPLGFLLDGIYHIAERGQ